jgi:hypothetical protein
MNRWKKPVRARCARPRANVVGFTVYIRMPLQLPRYTRNRERVELPTSANIDTSTPKIQEARCLSNLLEPSPLAFVTDCRFLHSRTNW